MNIITKLDQLVTHYFRKVAPFEIAGEILPANFFIGSPDKRALSEILSDVGDIKFPTLIINRTATTQFKLQREKNVPSTDETRIKVSQIVQNKYIKEDDINVNIEVYTYYPPKYFEIQYQVVFYCETMKHATEFQTMFVDKTNQEYVPIRSEKFKSVFFDTI